MNKIRIDWLEDVFDCDCAGCSGGWASGAQVYFNDELIIDMTPHASCFGGENYYEQDVYAALFKHLGYELEYGYGGGE